MYRMYVVGAVSAEGSLKKEHTAESTDTMELVKPQRLTLEGLLASLEHLLFEASTEYGKAASSWRPLVDTTVGENLDFGKVYIEFGPAVRRVLKRRGVPERELDDQVNNVFEKAFIKRDTLREPSKINAWLMSFAINVALNGVRKHDREIGDRALNNHMLLESVPEPHSSNPSDRAAVREGLAQLRELLQEVTKLERNLVVLVSVEGLLLQEAADACGVELGRARRTLSKARNKLKTALARRQAQDGWRIR